MASVTQVSSKTENIFVLSPSTDFASALAAAQAGRVDLGVFLGWLNTDYIGSADEAIDLVMSGVLQPAESKGVNKVWADKREAARAAAGQSAGQLRLAVGKRGGISLYGVNSRMPITLYVGQWQRVASYLKLPADSPLTVFIASKPVGKFSAAKDFTQGNDPAYLAEIRAGKHPHAKISGDEVTVTLAAKSE